MYKDYFISVLSYYFLSFSSSLVTFFIFIIPFVSSASPYRLHRVIFHLYHPFLLPRFFMHLSLPSHWPSHHIFSFFVLLFISPFLNLGHSHERLYRYYDGKIYTVKPIHSLRHYRCMYLPVFSIQDQ